MARKKKYIGIVINSELKTSKGTYKIGSEYDCKDAFSYNHLKSIKKIK
tara:strand:+ start:1524 stop:1667 length:144 start_codon:yes stop_codon:yes gene_type:complete